MKPERRVWRKPCLGGGTDRSCAGKVCGLEIEEGGWFYPAGILKRWMSAADLVAFERRAYEQSVRHAPRVEGFIEQQCGGCRWFGALNGDWGFCCNPASPSDGRVMFEHGGCGEHSNLVAQRAATDQPKAPKGAGG